MSSRYFAARQSVVPRKTLPSPCRRPPRSRSPLHLHHATCTLIATQQYTKKHTERGPANPGAWIALEAGAFGSERVALRVTSSLRRGRASYVTRPSLFFFVFPGGGGRKRQKQRRPSQFYWRGKKDNLIGARKVAIAPVLRARSIRWPSHILPCSRRSISSSMWSRHGPHPKA